MVSYLFKGCADRARTIVMIGNHDTNLDNPNRLDTLTPIINALNHPNLTYLKYSGHYNIDDVDYFHYSILDGPDGWEKCAVDVDSKKTVGLYHGIVTGAKTDKEFELSDIPVNIFKPFDITLLGDIHKQQYLDEDKRIAYAGSLIQQDYGEDIGKGYMIWDLETFESEYVVIPNDYGYYTIELVDGEMLNKPDTLPKNVKLKLRHSGTDKSMVKTIADKLKTEFSLSRISISGDRTKKIEKGDSIDLGDIINSRDTQTQLKLIKEYLERDGDIEQVVWDRIEKIHSDVSTKLNRVVSEELGTVWRPVRFQFSNMFAFGENNLIEFENVKGNVGLFGPNASGKSSVLDAMVYCLFDKCSKTSLAGKVMNNKASDFYCKFEFFIGSEEYYIERIGSTNPNGSVSVRVNFMKMVDGEYQSLNGTRRSDTNNKIKTYLGDYDDFILTTMSTQTGNKSFIDLRNTDRQELLYRFLDIYVFVELFKLAKEASSETATKIKLLKEENFDENVDRFEEYIVECDSLINVTENNITDIRQQLDSKRAVIETLIDSKLPIDSNQLSLESLKEKLVTNENSLKSTRDNIESTKTLLKTKMDEFAKVDGTRFNLRDTGKDDKTLVPKLEELKEMVKSNNLVLRNIEIAKKTIDHLQSKVNALDTHEYDPNCKYCVNNEFVKDAERAKIELNHETVKLSELESELEDTELIEKEISSIESEIVYFNSVMETHKRYIDEGRNLESRLQTLIESIKPYEEAIARYKNDIENYVSQDEAIAKNSSIDNEISSLRREESELKQRLDSLTSDNNQYISNKARYEQQLQDTIDRREEYHNLEDQFKAYEMYMKAVNKNGVPYMMLDKVMPTIQDEVNAALSGLVDFDFEIEIGEKGVIDAYINYDGDRWAVELSSGMERFVLSMAIRISLIRLCNLPKPNFMCIDEGFGSLDGDKLNSMELLFNYMKNNFDFILYISHISSLKDYVDTTMSISIEENKSKILVK